MSELGIRYAAAQDKNAKLLLIK